MSLIQFSFPFAETHLLGETFFKRIQRVLLCNPGLGAASVAGVYSIDLTTILRVRALNVEDLDVHGQDPTSATKTLWLGYKSPCWDVSGSVILVHVISSVRAARLRGLE